MFYLLSIYILSLMLCQIMTNTLADRVKRNNLKYYPNIIDAIRTLNQVAYIPIFNTFYALIIGFYYFKNGFRI